MFPRASGTIMDSSLQLYMSLLIHMQVNIESWSKLKLRLLVESTWLLIQGK
jgi:hypothetical protein